jgi:hypothetical protein
VALHVSEPDTSIEALCDLEEKVSLAVSYSESLNWVKLGTNQIWSTFSSGVYE